MKKQLIFRITALVMTLIMVSQMSLAVFANSTGLSQATIPVVTIQNNRAQVKLRDVAETIGLNVAYEASTKKITFTDSDTEIIFHVGNKQYYVNGAVRKADVAPTIFKNQTIVPVRVISEAFGIEVVYDAKNKTAVLNADGLNQIKAEEPGQKAELNNQQSQQEKITITSTQDLKVLNSGKVKKVVIDGKEVKFNIMPSKTDGQTTLYIPFSELKKALTTWMEVGTRDYEGKILLFSIAPMPAGEYDPSALDQGVFLLFYPKTGKTIDLDGLLFFIDPLPKIGKDYGFKLSDLIQLYKLDATVENGTVIVSTRNRGNVNAIHIKDVTVDERLAFLLNPDLTIKRIGRELRPRLQ